MPKKNKKRRNNKKSNKKKPPMAQGDALQEGLDQFDELLMELQNIFPVVTEEELYMASKEAYEELKTTGVF